MLNRRHLSGSFAVGALVTLVGVAAGLGQPPSAQETQVYRGSLSPVGETGVDGEVMVRQMGETLHVRLNANGLASGTHAQHIHIGEACGSFGGVAVPLDSDLSAGSAGEFPSTEGESSSLTYNQKGSQASYTELDLANHTVVVHASDGTAVACAELEKRGKKGGR